MDPELMAEWRRPGLQLATENMDKIAGLCREWQCKITLVAYPWLDNVAEGDRNSIQATHYPIALPSRRAEKVNAQDLYILRPELVGGAMATEIGRLGLVNKGQGGG